MFEHRKDAAHNRSGQDAIPDRKCALNPDHLPVVSALGKEIDRTDDAKSERQEPDGYADPETGPNQTAAPANLQCEINRGESADQSTNQQSRVHFAKENAAPKADENRS